jgi:hypothetical protein
VVGYATAEDVAFAARLAGLDRADRESDGGYDADCDEPPCSELVPLSDEELVAALAGPAHPADLQLLDSIDPRALSEDLDRVDYLRALDRVGGLLSAKRQDAIVAMAGESSSQAYLSEVHLEHELSVATRSSRYTAGKAIEVARALATTFPGFAAALAAGEITENHCKVLVERTRVVADDAVLAEIERRVLPKAKRLTPGEFGGEVAKVIARLDSDAAQRAKNARATRRVWTRQLDDGMGFLGLTHEWSTIQAIAKTVQAEGDCLRIERGGAAAVVEGVEDAAADACRADAMAARMLGTANEDGSITWDKSQVAVTVNVVMDLDTLRGESDQIALVDGQPVPAGIGREFASFATWWRRLVTDPVDGHLLDYGDKTYLPDKLRRFVLARDGGCRTPGCPTNAASRMQMDHANPFPNGRSSSCNCGCHCTTCHQLKTAGHADVTDSKSDGSCTWVTAWGQRIHVPPRSVLPPEPEPPPPAEPAPPEPEDPPPF